MCIDKISLFCIYGGCNEKLTKDNNKTHPTLLFSERLKFINTLKRSLEFRNEVGQLLDPISDDRFKDTIMNFAHRIIELENTVNSFKTCDKAWDEEKEFLDWCEDERYKEIIKRLDKLEEKSAPNKCTHHSWIVDGIPPLHMKCRDCGKIGDPNDTYVDEDMVNSGSTSPFTSYDGMTFTKEFKNLDWVPRKAYDNMIRTNNETIIRHLNRIKELEEKLDLIDKWYSKIMELVKKTNADIK
jgi:hypothetical protein